MILGLLAAIAVVASCYSTFLSMRANTENREKKRRLKNRATFYLFFGLLGLAISYFGW
jgi:phosphate starvation-inducible membrane PsiE